MISAMERDTVKALGFALDEQWFAIDISRVKEVVEWYELTPIPKAPDCAMGIFNYHGSVVTVVNPAGFFKLRSRKNTPETRIIVLSGEDITLGLKADRADKIESLPREDIIAATEIRPEKSYIRAVVPVENRLYNLLEPDPLLDAIEEEFEAVNLR